MVQKKRCAKKCSKKCAKKKCSVKQPESEKVVESVSVGIQKPSLIRILWSKIKQTLGL